MKNKTYIDQFMNLRCSGDILNIINPVQNISKEISHDELFESE